MKQLPIVQSAALLAHIPLADDFYQEGRMRVLGRPPVPFTERPIVANTVVSPEFFRTLEIPLKSGRIFDAHDSVRTGEIPVVVNQSLARQIFPGEDPVGQRLDYRPDEDHTTWSIVGVVGDIRGAALGADPPAMVYLCTCASAPIFNAGFAIRTAGDPKTAIRAVEQRSAPWIATSPSPT
jgi:hypothetical protein